MQATGRGGRTRTADVHRAAGVGINSTDTGALRVCLVLAVSPHLVPLNDAHRHLALTEGGGRGACGMLERGMDWLGGGGGGGMWDVETWYGWGGGGGACEVLKRGMDWVVRKEWRGGGERGSLCLERSGKEVRGQSFHFRVFGIV